MNIAIVGSGTMGRIVRDMALQNPGIEKVCNIEPALGETLWDVDQPDIVIDFSHPDALDGICSYIAAKQGHVGIVLRLRDSQKKMRKKLESWRKKRRSSEVIIFHTASIP